MTLSGSSNSYISLVAIQQAIEEVDGLPTVKILGTSFPGLRLGRSIKTIISKFQSIIVMGLQGLVQKLSLRDDEEKGKATNLCSSLCCSRGKRPRQEQQTV